MTDAKILAELDGWFLTSQSTTTRVEAPKERLRILQEVETNHFNGMATADEYLFRHFCPCSKIFARSRTQVIPRMRQVISAKYTRITLFFTTRKLAVLGVLPKASQLNWWSFINYHFLVWKNKPEIFLSDAKYDFFGAHEQFHVL
jgi:hypothetical protein